ncbi:hypothetical protein [Chondrinema litorale]|uniref:hypothetical protein n=1 Tax=Chondrinema litorale TaxID=2994555 RepID=UPI00254329DE|nr:hypothetical protein [Chondrinema litorale]UZR95788.1 hypothetical protein OQ292_08175 [Chondrinema litorale]
MEANYKVSIIYIIFLCLLSSFTDPEDLKPTVKVIRNKPQDCDGKGSVFDKIYVGSQIKDEQIEIWFFVQKYDLQWLKKVYTVESPCIVSTDLNSCTFTGNYLVLAFYKVENESHDINIAQVPIIHNSRGEQPKFRVTRRRKLEENVGGGVLFETGEVFTPKGEAIEITLFMEKKDGSWRKKHFNYIGSGNIDLNTEGNDLTGKYKYHIDVKHDYTQNVTNG